jgi:hypothetical protein
VCAATAARREHLRLVEERGLRWIASPESSREARRGFCAECGSSLFWEAGGSETVSIAAGTLDAPTGLRTVAQAHTAGAGDYYELAPSLPAFEHGAGAAAAAVPET